MRKWLIIGSLFMSSAAGASSVYNYCTGCPDFIGSASGGASTLAVQTSSGVIVSSPTAVLSIDSYTLVTTFINSATAQIKINPDLHVTTVTTNGPGAGQFISTENTQPAGISGSDILYGDSGSHLYTEIANNGSTGTVVISTGLVTAGDCAYFSATGKLSDAGASCGTGTGGGGSTNWLSVGTGTASGFTGPISSTGTQVIIYSSSSFKATPLNKTTVYIDLLAGSSPSPPIWGVQMDSNGVFGASNNLTNTGSTITISGTTMTYTGVSEWDANGVLFNWNGSSMSISSMTYPNSSAAVGQIDGSHNFYSAAVSLSSSVVGICPAANLPADVAYTDALNTFTQPQTVNSSMTVQSDMQIGQSGSNSTFAQIVDGGPKVGRYEWVQADFSHGYAKVQYSIASNDFEIQVDTSSYTPSLSAGIPIRMEFDTADANNARVRINPNNEGIDIQQSSATFNPHSGTGPQLLWSAGAFNMLGQVTISSNTILPGGATFYAGAGQPVFKNITINGTCTGSGCGSSGGVSVYPATSTAMFPWAMTASSVTISSNTFLPGGATFYAGAGQPVFNNITINGTCTGAGCGSSGGVSVYPATASASFPWSMSVSSITISSNTILPGATVYQGGGIVVGASTTYAGNGTIYMSSTSIVGDEYNNGTYILISTINWTNGNRQTVTLTANTTFLFTNPGKPGSFILRIQTGAGSFTASWPGTVKWAGGITPIITTTASKNDIASFDYAGDGNYYGVISQNF